MKTASSFLLLVGVWLIVAAVVAKGSELFNQSPMSEEEANYNDPGADRIKIALRHYVDESGQRLRQFFIPNSVQIAQKSQTRPVRQVNLSRLDNQLISRILGSSINPDLMFTESMEEKGELPVASIGQKAVRNGQSVIMRLPPRFGKRSAAGRR